MSKSSWELVRVCVHRENGHRGHGAPSTDLLLWPRSCWKLPEGSPSWPPPQQLRCKACRISRLDLCSTLGPGKPGKASWMEEAGPGPQPHRASFRIISDPEAHRRLCSRQQSLQGKQQASSSSGRNAESRTPLLIYRIKTLQFELDPQWSAVHTEVWGVLFWLAHCRHEGTFSFPSE